MTCHFPKRRIPGLLLLFCPLLKLWCEAPFLLDLTEARLSQLATDFKEVIISSLTKQSLYLCLRKVHKLALIIVRPTISSYSKFLPNEERTLHPKAQMYPNAASHLVHLPCQDVIPGSLAAIISYPKLPWESLVIVDELIFRTFVDAIAGYISRATFNQRSHVKAKLPTVLSFGGLAKHCRILPMRWVRIFWGLTSVVWKHSP